MAPVLGYWKLRGLAHPIRFLLEYTGESYEEELYEFGPAPDFDLSSWTDVKYTLGLPLPNLPYYIDGDIKLTQSQSILRHIGRKHDLCDKTEKEIMMTDMLLDQIKDMQLAFARLCYETFSPETKKEYLNNLQGNLKLLSDILGKQSWFTGEKITIADFIIYETLYANLALEPICLDAFQNLKDFHKRFEELPAIKNYMASPRYLKNPINGAMAKFGNQ